MLCALFLDENCIIPENTISFVSDVYKETCDSLRAVESTQKKVIEEVCEVFFV